MEKKEYMYQLLQKSEKDFESNNVLDAKMEIENLREKYQLYVEDNVKKALMMLKPAESFLIMN